MGRTVTTQAKSGRHVHLRRYRSEAVVRSRGFEPLKRTSFFLHLMSSIFDLIDITIPLLELI